MVAADAALHEELAWWGNCLGLTWSPFDSFLTLRGLRTLSVRLERHQASALKVAGWLEQQPQVVRVLYPALPSDPDHESWKAQFSGAPGLFTIEFTAVVDGAACLATGISRYWPSRIAKSGPSPFHSASDLTGTW